MDCFAGVVASWPQSLLLWHLLLLLRVGESSILVGYGWLILFVVGLAQLLHPFNCLGFFAETKLPGFFLAVAVEDAKVI